MAVMQYSKRASLMAVFLAAVKRKKIDSKKRIDIIGARGIFQAISPRKCINSRSQTPCAMQCSARPDQNQESFEEIQVQVQIEIQVPEMFRLSVMLGTVRGSQQVEFQGATQESKGERDNHTYQLSSTRSSN